MQRWLEWARMRSLDGANAVLVSSPASVLVAVITAWAFSLGLEVHSFQDVSKKLCGNVTSVLLLTCYLARLASTKAHSVGVCKKHPQNACPLACSQFPSASMGFIAHAYKNKTKHQDILSACSIPIGCDAFHSMCIGKNKNIRNKVPEI